MGIANLMLTDLKIHVAVAEMIADAGKLQGGCAADRGDCFRSSPDSDNSIVLCQQAVAVPENNATLKKEPGFLSVIEADTQPASGALRPG